EVWVACYQRGRVTVSKGSFRGQFSGLTDSGRQALVAPTMLRGKSRLNVGWLGYSPGLFLEKEPLAARTPRNPRG
ncbi:vacuolar ATPase assembly integral membrane protein VMA21 isoform X1, partial [Sigmodon hispidus]